tara:strand:+ start:10371 stop:10592 length:222 start_codon:yes stop_codon:yes gene_type:complete
MNKLFSDLRESLKPQRTEIKKYKVGNNSVSLIHKGESYEVEVDNVTIGEQFDDIMSAEEAVNDLIKLVKSSEE